MTTIRKPAPRLPQPASRYWKGKAPKGVAEVQSDSDYEGEEEQPIIRDGDIPVSGDHDITDEDEGELALHGTVAKSVKAMNVTLRDVNISKEGKVIVGGREESGRTEHEEDEEEEEEEEEATGIKKEEEETYGQSSEYESESEEEEKPKLQFRPVFVPKRARVTILEKEAVALDSEEAFKRKEMEAEERRKQSHDMVAESIKRELAEKEKEDNIPDVDDTDGLEPEVEFEAWRLRELGRIKKEKEEEILREQEREEIERRRAMPEEQRLKEDLERAKKSREEKPKGQQKFLQKYWHKGAFHQDDAILKKHDYTQATESTMDVTLLPQVMQVKNFGKRSRTKYTHLLDQDTTVGSGGFGGTAPVRNGGNSLDGGGCFLCGGPHMKKGWNQIGPCAETRTVKVAVIGSGLTGLTTAYLLRRALDDPNTEFDVHLYEKEATIGMDAFSISLPVSEEQWRIDVPMRSFHAGYYPQLIAFYRSLGVTFRSMAYSYSFSTLTKSTSRGRHDIMATTIYNGSSGFAGVSMPSYLRRLHSSSKNHDFVISILRRAWIYWFFTTSSLVLLFCYLRTLVYAMPAFRPSSWKHMTLEAWCDDTVPTNVVLRYLGFDAAWTRYIRTTLLPLFSAICTAPKDDILLHPVEEILDYIWLTFASHHLVVTNGVQNVVSKLILNAGHIHLSSQITAVHSDPGDRQLVSISYSRPDGLHTDSGFHHVVFAVEAHRAIPLLSSYVMSLSQDATFHKLEIEKQMECLSTFKYRTSIVLNHTDRSLLPEDERDIRDLNFVDADAISNMMSLRVSPSFTMATHVITPPEGYPGLLKPVYQTTNPIMLPRMDCLLSHAKLERAVLTLEAKEALRRLYCQRAGRWWNDMYSNDSKLGCLQGAGKLIGGEEAGIWICGSYAYPGIPLLEGCVVSARSVVEEGIFRCEGVNALEAAW
ncbi:hypothetical protein AMATHDRAFT_134337 [Amanita thiersii Skay4041]|uniref:Micro-fibrillar-associated protein 1 C-terminal domain-containing protein n=1 Tax=Amanita thiersii Skay4041 TaxID=703135 RepID=A0A2A9P1V8_9AGAR|nr:hypothetical protein AMATHDRAFT_134337 [Amanita thiersii Skay4041]